MRYGLGSDTLPMADIEILRGENDFALLEKVISDPSLLVKFLETSANGSRGIKYKPLARARKECAFSSLA